MLLIWSSCFLIVGKPLKTITGNHFQQSYVIFQTVGIWIQFFGMYTVFLFSFIWDGNRAPCPMPKIAFFPHCWRKIPKLKIKKKINKKSTKTLKFKAFLVFKKPNCLSERILSNKWVVARQNQQNDLCLKENTGQPGLPPRLISLCCPHEETLGPELSAQWSWCPGWSESSLSAHVILLVLLCGGSVISWIVNVYGHHLSMFQLFPFSSYCALFPIQRTLSPFPKCWKGNWFKSLC